MQIAFPVKSSQISRHRGKEQPTLSFRKDGAPSSYHPTVNYDSGILSSCGEVNLRVLENSMRHPPESQIKTAAGVTYTYDGSGRRVSKSTNKLYWYGSGGEILAETDASGNTLNEYIFFGGKRIAILPSGGNAEYYVEDLLGSSRLMTTNNGTVCYDADFDPFGGEHAYTNSCSQAYKFEGKERDTETGNDDFGARYYTSRFGRWLSADWSSVPVPVPYANLTNPQTLNLYAMVADDPESFADLDGHITNASQGSQDPMNGGPSCAATGQGGTGSAISGNCGASQTANQTDDQQQAQAAKQQAQNNNLKKEVEGIKTDQEKWNSILKPLIEIASTVVAFLGGDPIPEVPPETPNGEVLTEGTIFRSGGSNPGNLTDSKGVSFRDSLSDPIGPGTKPVFTKDEYIKVDISQLPDGSAVRDNKPAGHVTVKASPSEVKAAIVGKGKLPKIPEKLP